jgi:hypothetical protein
MTSALCVDILVIVFLPRAFAKRKTQREAPFAEQIDTCLKQSTFTGGSVGHLTSGN